MKKRIDKLDFIDHLNEVVLGEATSSLIEVRTKKASIDIIFDTKDKNKIVIKLSGYYYGEIYQKVSDIKLIFEFEKKDYNAFQVKYFIESSFSFFWSICSGWINRIEIKRKVRK